MPEDGPNRPSPQGNSALLPAPSKWMVAQPSTAGTGPREGRRRSLPRIRGCTTGRLQWRHGASALSQEGVAKPGTPRSHAQIFTNPDGSPKSRERRRRQRLGEPICRHVGAREEVEGHISARLETANHVVGDVDMLGPPRPLGVVNQRQSGLFVIPHRHGSAVDAQSRQQFAQPQRLLGRHCGGHVLGLGRRGGNGRLSLLAHEIGPPLQVKTITVVDRRPLMSPAQSASTTPFSGSLPPYTAPRRVVQRRWRKNPLALRMWFFSGQDIKRDSTPTAKAMFGLFVVDRWRRDPTNSA